MCGLSALMWWSFDIAFTKVIKMGSRIDLIRNTKTSWRTHMDIHAHARPHLEVHSRSNSHSAVAGAALNRPEFIGDRLV